MLGSSSANGCEQVSGNAEQCDRRIKKLMEMCVRLEDVLEKHKHEYRFPLDARTEFKDAAYAVAQLNTSLGAFFPSTTNRLVQPHN